MTCSSPWRPGTGWATLAAWAGWAAALASHHFLGDPPVVVLIPVAGSCAFVMGWAARLLADDAPPPRGAARPSRARRAAVTAAWALALAASGYGAGSAFALAIALWR